jgi:hypothetical protein
VIARWKGIIEEIHFEGSIIPSTIVENLDLEKPSFGPSKWPRKLKLAKNSKLPKLPENCFEPFGKGGWPPISTWIMNPRPLLQSMDWQDWANWPPHGCFLATIREIIYLCLMNVLFGGGKGWGLAPALGTDI